MGNIGLRSFLPQPWPNIPQYGPEQVKLVSSLLYDQGRKKFWNPLVQWASKFQFSFAPT